MRIHPISTLALFALLGALAPTDAAAQNRAPKTLPLDEVARLEIPPIDQRAVAIEDSQRALAGMAPRFAIPHAVFATPETTGTWEMLDEKTRLWRLRIVAPGAHSINLGFTRYFMPEGGRLELFSRDGSERIRPFTAADNRDHGQLWTPIVRCEELVVALTIPHDAVDSLRLELTQVGYGYRGFTKGKPGASKASSGACNIDVVCPEGDPWRNEIPAVGVISTGGSLFCTGFMVNNTARDRRPFFMTAYHCGISPSNAASLVVYWNYETSSCGGLPNGTLTDFQSGSTFRARWSTSDFTLVELSSSPNAAWGVTYAGWDRSGADATSAVAIHHPNTDEKRISFENNPTVTTSYLGTSVPGDGTHERIIDWDRGTTEPGSSGSPLFDQNHRVIGQLHGGYAACGNDLSDWYGKFSRSWNGGGSSTTRLRDWLDAGNTGAMQIDTLGVGLAVSPSSPVLHSGPVGGPFTQPALTYTLSNQTSATISYRVSLTASFGILLGGGTGPISGTLTPGGGQSQVLVALGPAIDHLAPGSYVEDLRFEDLTNAVTITIRHTVEIGKVLVYSFPFDSNPGWSTQGQWAFGRPLGAGGLNYGNPDPRSAHSGANVYGYNLAGDYTNNMPEFHLTSAAIDCSSLSGVEVSYQRWLNVEQPRYDHAYFRASNDGVRWVTIWENGSELTDTSWTAQRFDISAVADGQPRVFLRWTMGTTDSSWEYSGWNLDDVEIFGIPSGYFLPYGAPCSSPSFTPALAGRGLVAPGRPITLELSGGPGGGLGALLLSAAPDLSGATCLLLAPPLAGPFLLPLDPTGAASVNLTLPPLFWPGGVHTYAQGLTGNAAELAFSNGLDMYIE